ncbi:MAG: outer membrane lipoprotein carrier protein LolA [Pseudomonadota bacterium]
MKRRHFIALLAASTASPLAAQDNTLRAVNTYLNQLRSIQGRFTQVNANGTRSSGQYYLRRPGLLRFEYDGGQAMVIADGINVGVLDAKSNVGAQKYPLGQTPLRFLLRDKIDLTEGNLTRGVGSQDGVTSIVLQDPRAPRDGTMTLTLQNNPARLREWVVREASGQETRIILDTLEQARGLTRSFFSLEFEARKMGLPG